MHNYLDPAVLSKLKTMELRARIIVEGALIGIHRSPYHGFSTEFKDHRNYQAGDELKRIDWKVYARSNKFYTKQFEEESNLNVYIVLDGSASMKYTSTTLSKFEYASYLAASLSWLLMKQKDGVGLAIFDEKLSVFQPPATTKSHLARLMKILDESKPSNSTKILSNIDTLLAQIKKRSLVIILSDLLIPTADVIKAVKNISAKGNEVIIFHILDDSEYKLKINESIILKDLETEAEISVTPTLKSSYEKELNKCIDLYKKTFRSRNVDYLLIRTSEPLENALIYYLAKHKQK
ncbi:MAG: DUF58 domain-containing protein [bacterium]|nr:DUF58 domain-containing protein [bacterium]